MNETKHSDEWFQRLKSETFPFLKNVDEGERVKIAILDSGIKLDHPLLKGKIAAENCWDFVSNSSDIDDEVGRGTHMAYLLTEAVPQAKIFCGRGWRQEVEEPNTSQRIANAIKHAADTWNVDIIVMPFSLRENHTNIDNAIKECRNDLLMFAAVSNHPDQDIGYPALHPRVIGIYSNKSCTEQSTFCKPGAKGKFNFSAIGEEVNGAWPSDDGVQMKRQTGTSFSTPIVAAAAALILQFASQPGVYQFPDTKKLKRKEVMEKVMFECMTDGNTTGAYNLIQPWKLLNRFDASGHKSVMLTKITIWEKVEQICPTTKQ